MNNQITYLPPDHDDNKKLISPQTDLEYIKSNLRHVIETVMPVMNELADVASQAQNDKYYTALSTLSKAVVDANKALLESEKTNEEVVKLQLNNEKERNQTSEVSTTINNTLYVTSEDMLKNVLKMVKEQKQAKNGKAKL